MINILYFNSKRYGNENIDELFEKYECNVIETTKTIDTFKELRENDYDAIILTSSFEDISIDLFIDLVKQSDNYIKIIVLNDCSSEVEEELYVLDLHSIVDIKCSETLVALKLEKVIKELKEELDYKFYDANADLIVDFSTETITKSGNAVNVTTVEYKILECLIRNKDRVLSRKEIEIKVWGNNLSEFDSRVIDVYVLKLRRKLNIKNIETIRGTGYKWNT